MNQKLIDRSINVWGRCLHLWLLTGLLMIFNALFLGCGPEEEEDQGGVHVPEDYLYSVTDIPPGAEGTGIKRTEYSSQYLAKFVRPSEIYHVCLPDESFDDVFVAGLQTYLRKQGSHLDQAGLEQVINHALSTLDEFDSSKAQFSSRISIEVVRVSGGACDLLVEQGSKDAFPFNHEHFANRDRVFLHENQLDTESHQRNLIPVGYTAATNTQDQYVTIQHLIAKYLGLRDSKSEGSYIHNATLSENGKGWFITNDKGGLMPGLDVAIIYGFALAYADVLKPTDLDRYHHYQDQLNPGEVLVDPLLALPQSVLTPKFTALIGNPHLRGARQLPSSMTICYENHSGLNLSQTQVSQMFSFVNDQVESSLPWHLKSFDQTFQHQAVVGSSNCGLLASFRTDTQFPFATRHANGLYTHEGSIQDVGKKLSPLPVIYINTKNLAMDTSQTTGAKKYVGLVLEHEYAHFLGMKHSPDSQSLLSPAGYNTEWQTKGADEDIFREYLKHLD